MAAFPLTHLRVPVTQNVPGLLEGMPVGLILRLEDGYSGGHTDGAPAERKVVGAIVGASDHLPSPLPGWI